MNATNGTLIHTTITVATKKKDSGRRSHPWPSKSRPSPVRTWFTTPYCVSKSHCHTVSEATTGIAHASSSPVCTRSRTPRDMCRISSARPTPIAIVSAALTRQKAMERRVTRHR